MVIKSAGFEDEAKYIFEAEDKHTSGKLIIEGKYFYQLDHLQFFFAFIFIFPLQKAGINELGLFFFFFLDRNPTQIPHSTQGCDGQRERERCVYCGTVPRQHPSEVVQERPAPAYHQVGFNARRGENSLDHIQKPLSR